MQASVGVGRLLSAPSFRFYALYVALPIIHRSHPLPRTMACRLQVVLDEARASYSADTVQVLQSDTLDELEGNVDKIGCWIKQWSGKK